MSRIPLGAYWHLLARYLKPARRLLVLLAAILFAGVGVRLLTPWFAAGFLDGVTAQAGLNTLVLLAIGFCTAGIVDQVLSVAGTHLGANVSWQATNRLREDVLQHCLRLDESFHHQHPPGVMVERVDGDIRQLNNFFSNFALRLLANLSLVAGVLIVMIWVDWRLGLTFTGFAAIAMWTFSQIRGRAAPAWEQARQASAGFYGEVEEWLGGLPDIRTNGAEPYVRRRFASALRTMFWRERKAMAVSAVIGSATNLTFVIGGIVVLGMAVLLHNWSAAADTARATADSRGLGRVLGVSYLWLLSPGWEGRLVCCRLRGLLEER